MGDKRVVRQQIIDLLLQPDFPGLAALAGREPHTARILAQFLYSPEDLLHWRALEGLGYVAGAHPEQVQKIINRLLWLLNEDSGSFGWGAAAALGEIGRHQLPLVQGIISMFIGFLEEPFSQGPMLWGLGRLGEVHPEQLSEIVPMIVTFITNPKPRLRALAAWSLGKMKHRQAAPEIEKLLTDAEPVEIYDAEQLHQTSVGRVAREALERLGQ
jgi:hypothetical protein